MRLAVLVSSEWVEKALWSTMRRRQIKVTKALIEWAELFTPQWVERLELLPHQKKEDLKDQKQHLAAESLDFNL
jgi:hypothetical protein